MEEPLSHIVIIWSKGNEKKPEIDEDLEKSFHNISRVSVTWDKALFLENLKRFYAHSLQNKSEEELKQILSNKIEHCGDATFTAYVFDDLGPLFEQRKTSNGIQLVNTNVFDKKSKYRNWLGGGHRIHASDTFYETNKDLVLLFGKTIQDFRAQFPPSKTTYSTNQNILGVPQFKSVQDLFFVLNNTVQYTVLRNFEGLPDAYFVDSHGDIDLLVENKNFTAYVTGAINVHPEDEDRVYHEILIANEKVPFDFRYLGDGYYDTKWQMNILKNRVFENEYFRIDSTNYFFSLVYHAYIHKRKVSSDYKKRLVPIAEKLGLHYDPTQNDKTTFNLLNKFMLDRGYEYVLPKDATVFFNKKFIEQDELIESNIKNKIKIASSISRTQDNAYLAEVYETDQGILKVATNPIVTNEIVFLEKMAFSKYVPAILDTTQGTISSQIVLEKIKGFRFSDLVNTPDFWKEKNVRSFVGHLLQILEELITQQIIHRDIRPANILVVKTTTGYEPRLIDFGWAAHVSELNNVITPVGLGHVYSYPDEGFSDVYSMGKCLKFLGKNLQFLDATTKSLLNSTPKDYVDKEGLLKMMESLQQNLKSKQTKASRSDTLALMIKRYRVNNRLTKILGKKWVKKLKKKL